MKILITGGAGLIGSRLTKNLKEKGHEPVVLDLYPPRDDGVKFFKINLLEEVPPPECFEGVDAVVHLAGKNIFGRWNEKTKKEIKDSRVIGTKNLVTGIKHLDKKPEALVSASAVGFYGSGGEKELNENSPRGGDFLASVCVRWEAEARNAEKHGLRTVQVRTAPILSKNGGMLKKIILPYKLGLGGPLGSGKQWFPWIHMDDIIGIYVFTIENDELHGPYNAAAPDQIRQKEFSKSMAKTLKRPHIMKVPKFALKIVLGEVSEVALAGQKISSEKIRKAGYKFKFPDIKSALKNIPL